MPLYRAGTISLTLGSKVVTGTGTAFGTEAAPGDILVLSDQYYEIQSIESDTALTIDTNAAATAVNADYVVIRSVSTANNLYLMRKIDEFLRERQISLVEMRDWLNGTATGGPNGDGRYPLTDRFGVTILVKSASAMARDIEQGSEIVEGLLEDLQGLAEAVLAAESSKNAAATFEADALASKNAAFGAATDALASKNAAGNSATGAASSAATASTKAGEAVTSASTAATKAGEAAASASTATNARTAAESARDLTLGHKNAAANSESNALASADSAAQSAQDAAAIVLGQVFNDAQVSPTVGWTSQKISAELAIAGKVKTVNNVAPNEEGDVIVPEATTTVAGLLSSAEKNKLTNIQAGAQVNAVPVNTLVSTSTTLPLSASQGKALKDLIDTINALIQSDDATLDELQEIVDFVKLNRADLDALSISSIAGLTGALAGKLGATANAVSASKLATARTIAGKSFDGTANITLAATDVGAAATNHAHTAAQVSGLHAVATSGSYNDLDNKPTIPTVPALLPQLEAEAGTATTQRTISADVLKAAVLAHAGAAGGTNGQGNRYVGTTSSPPAGSYQDGDIYIQV